MCHVQSKVRLDLSMCARNIRRIAKNHEKRRGSPKLQSPGCHQVVEENNKRVTNAGKISQSKIEMPESTKKMGSRAGKSTGQLLPHTAHTAQAKSDGQLLDHNQVYCVCSEYYCSALYTILWNTCLF